MTQKREPVILDTAVVVKLFLGARRQTISFLSMHNAKFNLISLKYRVNEVIKLKFTRVY